MIERIWYGKYLKRALILAPMDPEAFISLSASNLRFGLFDFPTRLMKSFSDASVGGGLLKTLLIGAL